MDTSTANFSAALLKVASRCNLNCDYCYVYKHADQSWRGQPHFMATATIQQFAQRLNDYVRHHHLSEFCVIFHGGEPLLYGAPAIADAAGIIRDAVESTCMLDFSIQTNGTLLTDDALTILETNKISISLSLDGPPSAHNLHRLNHAGESTFEETFTALQKLLARDSNVFSGVIAVIDPAMSPRSLFEFFYPFNLPKLDLLLPDATHATPPPGRIFDSTLYQRWLVEAFEIWFTEFPNLPIRWFDAILGSRLGIPSPTDVMGFGEINLIVIESDGTYTDHDVFKITYPSGGTLDRSVFTVGFDEVATHPHLKEHRYRLSLDGLASECKACPVVESCAGGCVMHRYHPQRGLEAPTVYCGEMFTLLSSATHLLSNTLGASSVQTNAVVAPVIAVGDDLVTLCRRWRAEVERKADVLSVRKGWNRDNVSAAAVLLRGLSNDDSTPFVSAPSPHQYQWLGKIAVQSPEPWLTRPYTDSIQVLATDSAEVQYGISILESVSTYLSAFDEKLLTAMSVLITDVIFVASIIGDESGIFSFSDDTAPNVLYIAPYAGGVPIEADDLADSIFHEFRHQVLYHIERDGNLLFDHVHPRFPAPWRAGLRPAGGFLHGTFVFSGLAQFWTAMEHHALPGVNLEKAHNNARKCREQAVYGIRSLKAFALLTSRGSMLLDELLACFDLANIPMEAPGLLPPISPVVTQ